MANYRLLFFGTELSETQYSQIECYQNEKKEITIVLKTGESSGGLICLDKSTAIKFAKALRTHINQIED